MDIDHDHPYDLEDHAALAAEDTAVVDPLRATTDCDVPDGCGVSAGELHWPDCPELLGDDIDEEDDADA
jgi:hypothetical protein